MSKKKCDKQKRAASAEHQVPRVETQRRPYEDRGVLYSVPEGEPLDVVYRRPQPVPCPSCRRLRKDDGSQACIVRTRTDGVAYLRCRCCEHLFEAPVR